MTDDADDAAMLAHITAHGPVTYGAAAGALGWGASRAWRSAERLRRAGRVKLRPLGKMEPVATTRSD